MGSEVRSAGFPAVRTRKPVSFVVRKYGGSSLATPAQVRAVAAEIATLAAAGKRVVVVVSAMGDTTDVLVALAGEFAERPDPRELDQLMATGEQVSAALLALALTARGVRAVSLTGDQAGIVVGGEPGAGVIERVDVTRLLDRMCYEQVAVVAGFQGRDGRGELLTLGRGGSDTTAVALAAALGSPDCDIRTDVHGVRTADPRIVRATRVVRTVSYDLMAELAGHGATVLHPRSVALAERHGVRVRVRHSVRSGPGTTVAAGEPLEGGHGVVGIAHQHGLRLVSFDLAGAPAGRCARALAALVERGVIPDLVTSPDRAALRFTTRGVVPVEEIADELGVRCSAVGGLGSVSVIGVRLLDHPRYLVTTLRALGEPGAVAMTTAASRLTAVVPAELVEPAVRTLHNAFGLSARAGAGR